MVAESQLDPGTGPALIEASLTAIGIGLAFCCPRLGLGVIRRVERAFCDVARRRKQAVLLVGLAALLCRLAILPSFPIPHPTIHDEFSFLLAADTFASGRLTNPTPAMWTHFEAAHLTMVPTYMSMYFPGQGLVLAAGKVLLGDPWYGLLFINALMCAALCWMLQGWLPPPWALLGGIIAVLRISLFSWWINSYVGAGALAALGGALVLGGLPRFMRKPRSSSAIVMAIGMAILAITRLYECMLLCLAVGVVLIGWWRKHRENLDRRHLLRLCVLPLLLLVAVAAWMGYYDYRVFGNAVILPYTLDRSQYARCPYFIWQHELRDHVYRSGLLRNFYIEELKPFNMLHDHRFGLPLLWINKLTLGLYFFAGFALLPPLLGMFKAIRDRKIRPLIVCIAFLIAGEAIGVYFFSYYAAAFTAAIYALGLQAARHLRQWKPDGAPVGSALLRTSIALCASLALVRLFSVPLHSEVPSWPTLADSRTWSGPDPSLGASRAQVKTQLEHAAGQSLVIVRYAPGHEPTNDWIANAADIDRSKVIWGRDLGPAENAALIRHYPGRTVWLVEPDASPVKIIPYSLQLALADKHPGSIPE